MSLHDTSKSANCHAMSDVLNRIGDKWSVMVVGMLGRNGTLRFNELKRMINGVSQRMLTLTLRNLERDGLVTRTIYPEVPPRVEYGLTEMGRTLDGPIGKLWDWSAEHHTAIIEARAGSASPDGRGRPSVAAKPAPRSSFSSRRTGTSSPA
jgi:DNA-binding HxlR family transcriptional regulator